MNSFFDLVKERYSVRKFADKEIPQEVIDQILSAAKTAPTACNYQPQKIYVVRSAEARENLKKASPCTFDAPLIMVVGFDKTIASRGRRIPHDNFGDTDSSIVCCHLMLAAQDLGLGSCWVGMFISDKVREVLDIPENIQIMHLLPMGYPAEDSEPIKLHFENRDDSEIVEYR